MDFAGASFVDANHWACGSTTIDYAAFRAAPASCKISMAFLTTGSVGELEATGNF
jgi:hypothetical protein